MIVDPIALMAVYLDGRRALTGDERELLLFALYIESKAGNPQGIAQAGIRIWASQMAAEERQRPAPTPIKGTFP